MSRLQFKPGDRFGMLTIVRENGRAARAVMYECKCDCGKLTTTRAFLLKAGTTKSCGCLIAKNSGRTSTSGFIGCRGPKTPEYFVWRAMLQRCTNSKFGGFKHYGGRGISVHDSWFKYDAFYADMGPRPSPSHELDRIDNNGGYCKDNCRWSTVTANMRNRSNSVRITHLGETKLLVEWCEHYNIDHNVVRGRLFNGWSNDKAFSTPTRNRKPNQTKKGKKK